MARTPRKKKTEDVQELPLDAEPAHETTPEFKAEKPKFPENPGNDKQDTEAWAKAALVDPQPILPFKAPKPPTPEEVTKESQPSRQFSSTTRSLLALQWRMCPRRRGTCVSLTFSCGCHLLP